MVVGTKSLASSPRGASSECRIGRAQWLLAKWFAAFDGVVGMASACWAICLAAKIVQCAIECLHRGGEFIVAGHGQ